MTFNIKMTKTTFAIAFLAMTLLLIPATSGTAFANQSTTVSPSGEAIVAFEGNCYAYITLSTTFSTAFADASTKTVNGVPGHLATLSSAPEDAAADSAPGATRGWIGFTQDPAFYGDAGQLGDGSLSGGDGGWGWVTGEPVVYTNWNAATSEPNNADGNENYGENNFSGTFWNDLDSGNLNGGYFVEFEDACPTEVEKTWTHTDYNWDQICDISLGVPGFVNATGFCVVSDVDNTEIGFRPANINNVLDDVLADPLPLDSNGNYIAFAQVHRNDKFSNTNPGAFYALTTVVVTSNLSSVTVSENYDQCTDDGKGILKFVSKKITRNVKVTIADPNGDVTEITDDLYDIPNAIMADINSADIDIDLGEDIPAGSTIYVLVKFQDNLKGKDAPSGIFDDMCDNNEEVGAFDGNVEPFFSTLAEAALRITNIP